MKKFNKVLVWPYFSLIFNQYKEKKKNQRNICLALRFFKVNVCYSFIPLFGSFNGENKMCWREHLFLYILSKESNSQIFIPPKFGGIRENEIIFNKFFTKTFKIHLYI